MSSDSLAALILEERALRLRKQNIASFGYSWIRPAGCAKTMQGVRDEEAEREEGAVSGGLDGDIGADFAGEGELNETMGQGVPGPTDGLTSDTFERDLDDDIPEAEGEGLVEEGDEGLEDEADVEERNDDDDDDGLLDRDLDDDIPEGFGGEDEDEDDAFDDQPDLDDDIPSAPADAEDSFMERDLDADFPNPAEEEIGQQQEWEHTDTEAEDDDFDDDDDDDDDDGGEGNTNIEGTSQHYVRPSLAGISGPLMQLTPHSSAPRDPETERLFLLRRSGGSTAGIGSSPVIEDRGIRSSRRRRSRRHARVTSDESL